MLEIENKRHVTNQKIDNYQYYFRMNNWRVFPLVLLLACLTVVLVNSNSELANGLGDHIDWHTWSDALTEAKKVILTDYLDLLFDLL